MGRERCLGVSYFHSTLYMVVITMTVVNVNFVRVECSLDKHSIFGVMFGFSARVILVH